jgi:hypothetical protein
LFIVAIPTQKEHQMKTIAAALTCLVIFLSMIGAKTLYDWFKTPELPENIELWTTEQLEDQTFEYIDAIEVIKDEQRRRERQAARNR